MKFRLIDHPTVRDVGPLGTSTAQSLLATHPFVRPDDDEAARAVRTALAVVRAGRRARVSDVETVIRAMDCAARVASGERYDVVRSDDPNLPFGWAVRDRHAASVRACKDLPFQNLVTFRVGPYGSGTLAVGSVHPFPCPVTGRSHFDRARVAFVAEDMADASACPDCCKTTATVALAYFDGPDQVLSAYENAQRKAATRA